MRPGLKTYLTEYEGYACEDIEAPYWDWAEDELEWQIQCGRLPPGTVVVGELVERIDYPEGDGFTVSPIFTDPLSFYDWCKNAGAEEARKNNFKLN